MAKTKLRLKVISNETQPSKNENSPQSPITEATIAQRGYAIYLARGGQEGHGVKDWRQDGGGSVSMRQSVN